MKVVLDTNVFVSGIHWNGSSADVLKAWFNEEFEHLSSLAILEEITRVLLNFKISLEKEEIMQWISIIAEKSELIEPQEKLSVIIEDPDDNKFIEVAKEGKANYIVSQDKHLLKIGEYYGIKIITPQAFLDVLNRK